MELLRLLQRRGVNIDYWSRARTLVLIRLWFLLVRRMLNLSRLGFLREKQSFFNCVGYADGTCNDNMFDKSTKMIIHDARRVIGRAILNAVPSGRV